MDDLISRQALLAEYDRLHVGEPGRARKMIEDAPSAQPDLNEWCTDCKEYDKETHHCPRFNRVIREALKDAELGIIRCKDCIYYRQEIDMCDEPHSTAHNVVQEDDYCSRAERRPDCNGRD